MKITRVVPNNRRRAFEVQAGGHTHLFPYAVVRPTPTARDRVTEVHIDEDQGREGFTYRLAGGDEGAVHIDHVLEYNRDPGYMAEQLLYRLSVSARDAVAQSSLSTRELIRRLGTSPTQFYRLLDPTNYRKSMRQLLALLGLLGYEVDLTLTPARQDAQHPLHPAYGRIVSRS